MPDRFDKLRSPRDARVQVPVPRDSKPVINNVGLDPKPPRKPILGDLSVKPLDYVNKLTASHRICS